MDIYCGKHASHDFTRQVLPCLYANTMLPAVKSCIEKCEKAFAIGKGIIPAMNEAYQLYDQLVP